MEFGAITGYVDLAQILLYLFWLFFAGLIFYLVREGHREGYPMETDGLSREVKGFPVPDPKTFKLADGTTVTVPDPRKLEPKFAARVVGASPGSPLEPTGDPMASGVGPGAYANRADVPEMTAENHPKIVPLRAASTYGVSADDVDPRGLSVFGGDGKSGGTVRELWVDQSEMLFRYLEVETSAASGARRVLVPIPFARIARDRVDVQAIYSHHFAAIPGLKDPHQVTMLEEEKITAYFGAGTLYADPKRSEPIL